MALIAIVTPGWVFSTGDYATAPALNALGTPTVSFADGLAYVGAPGTLASPGFSFIGDDSGIAQLAGANTGSLVGGGIESARWTPQGFGFAAGTVGAPGLFSIADVNSGFYSIADGSWGYSSNGALIATFSASGLNATSLRVGGVSVRTSGVSPAEFTYNTDFTGTLASTGLTQTVVATGTIITATSSASDPDRRGLAIHGVTAVADRAVTNLPMIVTAGGSIRFRLTLGGTTAGVLSTPSERFYILVGLTNAVTDTLASAAGNGAWFQYTDSASAQWQTVTMSGGVKETQTTSTTLAAAGAYYTLEIRRVTAGAYEFYINGVLATTHTTSTHTGIAFNLMVMILEKTVGATLREVSLDSIEVSNAVTRI